MAYIVLIFALILPRTNQQNKLLDDHLFIAPTITTVNPNIGILNGENVTFVCVPSDLDIEIFWTYETKDGSRGTVTVANVSESRFLSHSPLLHRLVLSNATYGDAGIYRCIPQGPIGEVVSETITLNVLSSK